jgi:hypothetical protein
MGQNQKKEHMRTKGSLITLKISHMAHHSQVPPPWLLPFGKLI